MSAGDPALDRRCRRLARVYPDPARAAEVATTLAEANAGRRAPRASDVADVLWHGAVARLGRRAPSTRFGTWGDACSVAVVQTLVLAAATAAVAALRAFERPAGEYPPYPFRPRFDTGGPFFYSRAEAYGFVAATALGVAAAVLACRGRVRGARVATVAAALAACAAVAGTRASGNDQTLTDRTATLVSAAAVLLVLCVVGTTAVARAAALVPPWWWCVTAAVGAAAAVAALAWNPQLRGGGRSTVVVAAFAMQAGALLLLATPLAARAPGVAGGTALLGAAALATLADRVDGSFDDPRDALALEVTLGTGVLLVLLTGAVVTWTHVRARRS